MDFFSGLCGENVAAWCFQTLFFFFSFSKRHLVTNSAWPNNHLISQDEQTEIENSWCCPGFNRHLRESVWGAMQVQCCWFLQRNKAHCVGFSSPRRTEQVEHEEKEDGQEINKERNKITFCPTVLDLSVNCTGITLGHPAVCEMTCWSPCVCVRARDGEGQWRLYLEGTFPCQTPSVRRPCGFNPPPPPCQIRRECAGKTRRHKKTTQEETDIRRISGAGKQGFIRQIGKRGGPQESHATGHSSLRGHWDLLNCSALTLAN